MNDTPVAFSLPVPSLPTRQITDMVAFAQMIEVNDADSAEVSAAELNAAREIEKAAQAELEEWLKPLRVLEQKAREQYRPIIQGARHAAQLHDRKLGFYQQRQQDKVRQLEMQAREAARQEQERLAHEAAAREDEARQQAERLREQAEAQAQAGNVTGAAELANRALQAEIAGQQDAQQLVEQLQLTAPEPVATAPKPAGVTFRKVIDEIVCDDVAETALAVSEGKVSKRAIKHDLVWLRQHAVSMGDEFNVPGVRVVWRTATAVRRK